MAHTESGPPFGLVSRDAPAASEPHEGDSGDGSVALRREPDDHLLFDPCPTANSCRTGRDDVMTEKPLSGDAQMRAFGASEDVPVFDDPAFTPPDTPLSEARVAIVTSAALHRADQDRFAPGDTGFRVLERADRDIVMGHWSPNFDHTGFQLDHNVVYPIDRLEELEAEGVIGEVAPRHFAFAGNQPATVSELRLDTGPACAKLMLADGVDVVVLTPV